MSEFLALKRIVSTCCEFDDTESEKRTKSIESFGFLFIHFFSIIE